MRETRQSGSEGGVRLIPHPYPYPVKFRSLPVAKVDERPVLRGCDQLLADGIQ